MIREAAGTEGERFRSIAEVVQSHASARPDERCLTFLDGEEELATATWRELDRAARARAVSLRRSATPGSRIVLVYRSEQHFAAAFLGCLYAGMVPVPLSAPHRTRPAQLSRFAQVVEDARPALALSESAIVAFAEALPRTTEAARALKWAVAEWEEGDVEDFTPVRSQPEETAFIQYTSGSTSAPKGVLVSHANIMANVRMLAEAFRLTAADTWVSWLPLFHDMGLIGHLIAPWVIGGHAVLMPPLAFLQRPMRWMEAVSRYRGTFSTAPNFAFALTTKRSTPEQRAQVELGSWTRVLCGAEPIRPDTLRSFAEAFSGSGIKWEHFFPCYGLAEGTLVVSGSKRRREAPVVLEVRRSALEAGRVEVAAAGGDDTQELIASGEVCVETEAVIVHPELRERCPPDQVGEIWLSGTAVGGGYWQRAEESAKAFEARLVEGGKPYLRTGDLGFIRDGALFITGRLKDLIIIRGRNLHPQDVGDVVEAAHPSLRAGSCSSFGVSVEGEERLVVAVEAELKFSERRATPDDDGTSALEKSLDELRTAVRSAVVEAFDVFPHAIVLLKVGRTLKTSSGKLQHRLMRQAYLAGELEELSAP